MSNPTDNVALPRAAEAVLTFLESVGKRTETELYLRLFRQLPRESFAIIAAEGSLLAHAQGVIAEQLRYLSDLGLIAPIVVGLWEPELASVAASKLQGALTEAGLASELYRASSVSSESIRAAIRQLKIPILLFDASESPRAERFACVRELASKLETRKLVFVRHRGGLGPHGVARVTFSPGHVLPCHAGGISVINLRTDLPPLLKADILSAEDKALLESIAETLGVPQAPLVSVTSPLGLLRELFTVKGAGTLVKRGSEVLRADDYGKLVHQRLRGLLESSFEGKVLDTFFSRPPLAVFYESDYRGAAIVESSPVAATLSKFAVDPIAQGEGIGRDLWQAMVREFDSLIWRARPNNPIVPWYVTQCDGMMRSHHWVVFWRNVRAEDVPIVFNDLIGRPADIVRAQ